MAEAPPGTIQIIEPIVFEIETPTIPGLPTITTPPGIGIGGITITFGYICPLAIHCGSDDPCDFLWTLPLTLSLPLPQFSFPPQFNFPVFGFRFEIPPAIFFKCPFFPEEDATATIAADAAVTPGDTTSREDFTDGKASVSYKKILKENPEYFKKHILGNIGKD